MTLQILQELFEKIQPETDLNNLMERKFNLTMELGKLHVLLHDGNSSRDRSDVLACINAGQVLESIVNDKIQDIRQKELDARKRANIENDQLAREEKRAWKRYNIEESNFVTAAKRVLNRSTYQAIVKIAQEMPHKDIRKLRQKDLPMLILSVEDTKVE